MTSNKTNNASERRLGPDFWVKAIGRISLLAWVVFLVSLITFHYARPEMVPGYAAYLKIENEYRTEWDLGLSNFLFIELLICCVVSFVAIFVNARRMRRKTDRLHFNAILLFLVSLSTGLIVYFNVLNS